MWDLFQAGDSSSIEPRTSVFRKFHRLMAYDLQERKYITSESSSESSSDSGTLDFDMEVEERVGERDSQISSERSTHMPTKVWLDYRY